MAYQSRAQGLAPSTATAIGMAAQHFHYRSYGTTRDTILPLRPRRELLHSTYFSRLKVTAGIRLLTLLLNNVSGNGSFVCAGGSATPLSKTLSAPPLRAEEGWGLPHNHLGIHSAICPTNRVSFLRQLLRHFGCSTATSSLGQICLLQSHNRAFLRRGVNRKVVRCNSPLSTVSVQTPQFAAV
jgi:hypothetical protein